MKKIISARRNHQLRGYSLIELAIVLMISAVLLSGVWLAASRAWDYTKREQAKEIIISTVGNMRNYLGGQAGVPALGTSLLTAQLIGVNVIPGFLVRSGGCAAGACADNPWGSSNGGAQDPLGTFRVCSWVLGSVACGATTSSFFGVQMTGLSYSHCISLIQAITGAAGPRGMVGINVNGSDLLAANGLIQGLNDVQTQTACMKTGAADGAVTATFIFSTQAPSN